MITIESMTNTISTRSAVYIGLGSNLGDRERNLRETVARLESRGFEVRKLSSIYETEPVGLKDQSWFLNQVIEVRIETIGADSILAKLLDVENEMGRERGIINGPRVIDIDLLLVGAVVTGDLMEDDVQFRAKTQRTAKTQKPGSAIVPHPRMHERRFVLEPLCEIAPEAVHPVLKMTCSELLASLHDASLVKRYEPMHSNP